MLAEIMGRFHQHVYTSSFYTRRSQRRKMTDDLTFFFALLVSLSIKAARKMLVKSTLGQTQQQDQSWVETQINF